jgi:hypothetical protein
MQVTELITPGRPSLLLATKLLPPRLPSGLIERPRLIALAARAEDKRLTVIKAPAGFGKTSLALAWLNQLPGSRSMRTTTNPPAFFTISRRHCGRLAATSARRQSG